MNIISWALVPLFFMNTYKTLTQKYVKTPIYFCWYIFYFQKCTKIRRLWQESLIVAPTLLKYCTFIDYFSWKSLLDIQTDSSPVQIIFVRKKKNCQVIGGRERRKCNSEGKGVSILWRNPSDNIIEFSTGNYLHSPAGAFLEERNISFIFNFTVLIIKRLLLPNGMNPSQEYKEINSSKILCASY